MRQKWVTLFDSSDSILCTLHFQDVSTWTRKNNVWNAILAILVTVLNTEWYTELLQQACSNS